MTVIQENIFGSTCAAHHPIAVTSDMRDFCMDCKWIARVVNGEVTFLFSESNSCRLLKTKKYANASM